MQLSAEKQTFKHIVVCTASSKNGSLMGILIHRLAKIVRHMCRYVDLCKTNCQFKFITYCMHFWAVIENQRNTVVLSGGEIEHGHDVTLTIR